MQRTLPTVVGVSFKGWGGGKGELEFCGLATGKGERRVGHRPRHGPRKPENLASLLILAAATKITVVRDYWLLSDDDGERRSRRLDFFCEGKGDRVLDQADQRLGPLTPNQVGADAITGRIAVAAPLRL